MLSWLRSKGSYGETNWRGDYTEKQEKQIFLKYKKIENGAVAKSYVTNGLLIYGEIFAHFLIQYIRKPFLI